MVLFLHHALLFSYCCTYIAVGIAALLYYTGQRSTMNAATALLGADKLPWICLFSLRLVLRSCNMCVTTLGQNAHRPRRNHDAEPEARKAFLQNNDSVRHDQRTERYTG